METQLLTLKAMYKEGKIEFLSPFQPKGQFHVLVTFLEPVESQDSNLVPDPEIVQEIHLRSLNISPREMDVLELVRQGMQNHEIAVKLELGEGTIRNYISSLLDKLGGKNRIQMVKRAEALGLFDWGSNK